MSKKVSKAKEGVDMKDGYLPRSNIMKNNSDLLIDPNVLTETSNERKEITISNQNNKPEEISFMSDEMSEILQLGDSTVTSNERQQITVLDENDKLEEISFTSDEILESLQLEDSTVEIVGFIDEIDGPKIVGKTQHYQLLKFILNNNSRHRIQIVVWNAEIDQIKHHIQPNRIIHIDGAKAKKPKVSNFNQGTLPYELIIRSNTIINNIGSFDLKKVINAVQPRLVDLPEISGHLNSCILVRGFIKTRLNTFTNSFKTIGSGSITDGVYKLEVQIMEYEHENFYNKGDYVELKGYVKILNDIFYLEIQTMSDIKLIRNQTLSFAKLLLGSKPILKRTLSESSSGLPSKIARN